MGSVTILSSLGAGHYAVRVNFDNARIEARKTAIQTELDGFAAKLVELVAKKAPFDAVLLSAKTALDDYTKTATPQQLVNDQATMHSLIDKVFKAQIDVELAAKDIAVLKLKKTALDKELVYLDKNCPATIDTTAWCVEYKENLTGTIESIEVDYLLERDNITDQIRNDTGVWLPGTARTPTARLQHALATSAYAAWFNLCMAPAMQRHKPMYRIATITALDKNTNTCDLDFVGRYDVNRYSSKIIADKPILPNFEQEMDAAAGYGDYKIPPAQQIHYTGAKVEYGSCNAKAFVVGDKVIVDLHKGVGVPTVIGFYENPRKCAQWTQYMDCSKFTGNIPLGASGLVVCVQSDVIVDSTVYSPTNPDYSTRTVTRTTTATSSGASYTQTFPSGDKTYQISYSFSYDRSLSSTSVTEGSVSLGISNSGSSTDTATQSMSATMRVRTTGSWVELGDVFSLVVASTVTSNTVPTGTHGEYLKTTTSHSSLTGRSKQLALDSSLSVIDTRAYECSGSFDLVTQFRTNEGQVTVSQSATLTTTMTSTVAGEGSTTTTSTFGGGNFVALSAATSTTNTVDGDTITYQTGEFRTNYTTTTTYADVNGVVVI